MKRALIFYSVRSTFVKKDIEILSPEFEVREHDFHNGPGMGVVKSFISQFFFLLLNIWGADLLICEFASYQSLLPALMGRLLGKPCLIVVGGTDAHYFPGIGYGNWQKKYLKTFTVWSFKLCSHIAPKHHSLMECEYTYDEHEPHRQGIYARLPHLKTPYTEIPNGYDFDKWTFASNKEPNTFITVANGWQYGFQKNLKGIDLILAVAPAMPTCRFIILGVDDKSVFKDTPANVEVLPPASPADLVKIFGRCQFYLQLSLAEGFPNSICEAMLCGCIPVGSDVFSIPEIIGDSGFVLKRRDASLLKQLLEQALLAEKYPLMEKARARVAANYTLQNRAIKFAELCRYLIGKR